MEVVYFALTFSLVNFVLHEEHLYLTLTLFTLALLKEQICHPHKEKRSRALSPVTIGKALERVRGLAVRQLATADGKKRNAEDAKRVITRLDANLRQEQEEFDPSVEVAADAPLKVISTNMWGLGPITLGLGLDMVRERLASKGTDSSGAQAT